MKNMFQISINYANQNFFVDVNVIVILVSLLVRNNGLQTHA